VRWRLSTAEVMRSPLASKGSLPLLWFPSDLRPPTPFQLCELQPRSRGKPRLDTAWFSALVLETHKEGEGTGGAPIVSGVERCMSAQDTSDRYKVCGLALSGMGPPFCLAASLLLSYWARFFLRGWWEEETLARIFGTVNGLYGICGEEGGRGR
jgi:hypothetical protein